MQDDTFDIAVVCALRDPELMQLLETSAEKPKAFSVAGDPHTYHSFEYRTRADKGVRLVAASPNQMGPAASAVLATKMILAFRPRLVAMVGIAAGADSTRQGFGDILAAEHTFDFGAGKLTDTGLQPDPKPLEVLPGIVARLKNWQTSDELAAIARDWPLGRPHTPLKLHVGPLGSGAAVLGVREPIDAAMKHWRKLIGVEMEAYAVHKAASDTMTSAPAFLCLKSICDFAAHKTDDWQDYAAYTAARLFHRFIVKEWPLGVEAPRPPARRTIRDVGHFPAFMDEIIDAIAIAKGEILIACDYAGYGSFSAPEKFRQYLDALAAARERGCDIRCIVTGAALQRAARDPAERLAGEPEYVVGMKQSPFPALLDRLAARRDPGPDHLALPPGAPRAWSYDTFLDALEVLENDCENRLKKMATVHQAPDPLPLYLWITDARAVWAIPAVDPSKRLLAARLVGASIPTDDDDHLPFTERAFVTGDRLGLVHRLRHIWQRYERQLASQDSRDLRIVPSNQE